MGCISALAILTSGLVCFADQFNPFDGPQPVAVFIQTGPWGAAIGAGAPRVAVYENGEAIFAKKLNGRIVIHHVLLGQQELDEIRQRVSPILAFGLRSSYDLAPNVTDQPSAMFYLRGNGREMATRVYGLSESGNLPSPATMFGGRRQPTIPPQYLLELHSWLCKFDHPGSQEWAPKYIEVMLSGYSNAPSSIQWPNDWPSLDSNRAIKRGDDYSIFLDGTSLPQLMEFLKEGKGRTAVDVDGKSFAISHRFTFPSEPVWQNALAGKARKKARKRP